MKFPSMCDQCTNRINWFLLEEGSPPTSDDYLVSDKDKEVWVDHYCSLGEYWHGKKPNTAILYWARLPKFSL